MSYFAHFALIGTARTNNVSEGFNHAFAGMAKQRNMNIYQFIQELKKQQVLTDVEMAKFNAGNEPKKQRKEVEVHEKAIQRAMKEFHEAMDRFDDADNDLITDDEDENDANAANSNSASKQQHPALALINAIGNHTRF